jgi:hypothetical protein
MNDISNFISDSTKNKKDSTAVDGNPTFQVDGMVGYSIDLDGMQDRFIMPDYGIWNGDFTIEAWSEIGFDPSFDHHLINMGGEYKFQPIAVIDYGNYDIIWRWYTNDWRSITFTSAPYPDGWHFFTGTYDFDGKTEAFFDAVSKGSDSHTGSMTTKSEHNAIGSDTNEIDAPWDGKVDEIRYSNIVRSAEWIRTTYNSINDPSNFISLGPEETNP